MTTPTLRRFAAVSALLCACILPLPAATMSAESAAPVVDDEDLANYSAVTGTDKWWTDSNGTGAPKGQTFTTGGSALRLKSFSFQVSSTQQAEPTKTYIIRVGEINGSTFTEIHSETATQDFTWNSGEFMTWTFDTPVILDANTEYGVDIGMTSSTSGWQSGIPYLNRTDNDFAGGTRYSSGTAGGGIGDITMNNTAGDMIFHADLELPLGGGFIFISGSPPDDETGALATSPVVATFSQNLVAGSGNITVRNLTDSVDTVIPVGDPQVTLTDNTMSLDLATPLQWSKAYAIRIDPGALEDDQGNAFAGITDDTTWNFTTADGDPLLDAIAELKDHILGNIVLSPAEIDAHKQTIDLERGRFDESAPTIATIFDLVTTYDTEIGPLWIARGQFDRNNQTNDLDWTIYHVMQYVMDEIYNAPTIAAHEATLDGYKFGSASHFPGDVTPAPDPANVHSVQINGSFPDTFGRHTQQWTLPARKPTGSYLAPGTLATVTVPPALVGSGYKIRVGAHSWDLTHRRWVRRLDRATILYNIDAASTRIASPYGGGIYIEVPLGADAGVVGIDITGAARAPYFSAKSFHATTNSEWITTERNHPAPWADFQSDKFMMQVPTSWVNNTTDPETLMANWDLAVDAMNDLMGFPRLRGKETLYPQVDVLLRSSVHAPGYPSVNQTYSPTGTYNGNHGSHLVQGPQTGWHVEFHEQGHAYFFPKFGGESESNVNLLHAAIWHRKFGYSLDHAFAASLGFEGNPHRTLDNTAVTWMTVFNFSPREVPMASGEKSYQLKGHAKFVDIARLYGWEGLDAFWQSFNQDEADGVPYSTDTDSMLLRLCQSVGRDIRPLFHFWGIHPADPAALESAVQAAGLTPPVEIYDQLLHYQSLVPADNAAFRTFSQNWWNKVPSINGYWTEREHARQWDTTALYGAGDQQRSEATNPGEIYNENSASDIEARIQELLDLYYPDGRPAADDYSAWAALYPGADLGDPDGDHDGDGQSNDSERLFGTHPDNASSSHPVTVPLDAAGNLNYTRRDASLTGHTYKVWVSTTLQADSWTEDTGATQNPGTPDATGIETVAVTLSSSHLDADELFVRISAE